MPDGTRAALLLFALLCSLGVVPILLRSLRPGTLLAVHGVGMCVAFGAAVAEVTARGDGAALGLPYLAMLALVVADRRDQRASRRLRVAASVVAVLGLLLALGSQLWPTTTSTTRVVTSVVGLGFAALMTAVLARRAREADIRARRAAYRTSALTMLVAGLALAAAGVDGSLRALWPLALGAAGGLVTAVRAPPHVAPTPRELVVALLLGIAAFFVGTAALGPKTGLMFAVGAALFDLALVALSRPLLDSTRVLLRASRPRPPTEVPAPDDIVPRGALAALAPMVDEPSTPSTAGASVTVRTSARRILESALEAARERHLGHDRNALRVDVVAEDADADIEGDPSALADALATPLDVALERRAREPETTVRVYVRGGFKSVTFEVVDESAAGEREPTPDPDPDRPFTSGDATPQSLALARSRVVVERYGGTLTHRSTDEGHVVQITVPRRRQRASSVQA